MKTPFKNQTWYWVLILACDLLLLIRSVCELYIIYSTIRDNYYFFFFLVFHNSCVPFLERKRFFWFSNEPIIIYDDKPIRVIKVRRDHKI